MSLVRTGAFTMIFVQYVTITLNLTPAVTLNLNILKRTAFIENDADVFLLIYYMHACSHKTTNAFSLEHCLTQHKNSESDLLFQSLSHLLLVLTLAPDFQKQHTTPDFLASTCKATFCSLLFP